jgi:hypothetical protein
MYEHDDAEAPVVQKASPPGDKPGAPDSPAEADVLLARIEKSLSEVRAHMNASARESRHKEFSFTLLAGGIAQAIVIALLIWALSDMVFIGGSSGETVGLPLVKLAFAGVLQLVALTAFVASRPDR